jgi:hypothetical protein
MQKARLDIEGLILLNGKIAERDTMISEETKTRRNQANAQIEIWKAKRADIEKKIALFKSKEKREAIKLAAHIKIVLGGVLLTHLLPKVSESLRDSIFNATKAGIKQTPEALAMLKEMMDKHPAVPKPAAAAASTATHTDMRQGESV